MRRWVFVVPLCILMTGVGCQNADEKSAALFVENHDLGVRVVEEAANDGEFQVPLGRHLARVDYNSRLRVTPVVSMQRAQLISDLSKLIAAVNGLSGNLAQSKLLDGQVIGINPAQDASMGAQDRSVLAALRAASLQRFYEPGDTNEPTAFVALAVMARAIIDVNAGSDEIRNVRMRAMLRQAQAERCARQRPRGSPIRV